MSLPSFVAKTKYIWTKVNFYHKTKIVIKNYKKVLKLRKIHQIPQESYRGILGLVCPEKMATVQFVTFTMAAISQCQGRFT